MAFERSQNVFSTGELDPRLLSRIDIQRYRTATATARDVMLSPQGPFRRRPGTVLDDDDAGHIGWILPFAQAPLTVNKNPSTPVAGETFTWTSVGAGSEEVSDNEISFDQAYEITHVYASAISVSSDRSSDFDVRFEFWDNARSLWVETAYVRVHLEAAETQEAGGGSLVYLSQNKDEGVRVGGFTKMRARIASMPDTAVTLSVTLDFAGVVTSILETSRVRFAPFNVSEAEQFILAFTDDCVTIYEQETASDGERELIQRANLSAPWSAAQIADIDWVQAFDTMIVVHEDVAPRKIVRQGDGRFWTIENVTFASDFVVSPDALHIPQDPVDDAGADNTGQPLIWKIELLNFSASDRYQLIVDGTASQEIAYDTTAATNVSRIQAALDALPGFLGTFTVSESSGVYSIQYDFTDKSLVPVFSEVDSLVFEGNGIVPAWKDQDGLAHTNDKWSATKGWPRSVTLYQERLWFGGAKSYPDEVWGSRVADLFSFWNEENLDNEAIAGQIRSRQLLNIRAVYPGRNLQFFTDAAEFFAPQAANAPLTPNDFVIQRATNRGIAKNVRPVEITGATTFLESNRDAVREFLFIDTEQSYDAQDVSLLSAHLLDQPVTMKRWPAQSGQEFDLILFPQEDRADMPIFGSLRGQDIAGWFRWSGDWRDVEVMLETLYGARRTTIRGDDVTVICRFDDDAFMDLLTADPAVDVAISDGVITNLWAHKGADVQIRVDDSFFDETTLLEAGDSRYTGSGNPQIDLDTSIDSSYQVGRPFTPVVQQLPVVIETEGGLIWMDRKKRVGSGTVEVRNTAAIEIAVDDAGTNTERYASETAIGTDPPETTTGRVHFAGRLGWGDKGAVTIKQPLPYPMEVLAIQSRIFL